jgi:translation initiation factor IF-2
MAKKNEIKTEKKTETKIPVVAILGHVDHGKTSLLDFIRQSRLASSEEGGITQHTGAYQIDHKGRKITFIDTPGHEAFSAMRARGGKASDIVLLLIAADDGVMPQTKESIAHIKAAETPFIVVVNKIDLPGTNIEKIKKQLAESDVLVEGYGGDVPVVAVSAKTGQGVDDLLEMINLVADVHELKEENSKEFRAVVIESKLDKFKGPVASLIIKSGILKVGDSISTATTGGKIKSLTDSGGEQIKEASVSTPVEVLGFVSVPKVGEEAVVSSGEVRREAEKEETKKLSVTERLSTPEKGASLIIKTDVAGTLEAITSSIEKLKGENREIKIYYAQTGDITEGDVLLAAATKSIIIGFNVDVSSAAKKLADEEGVLISQHKLIYELLTEVQEGLDALTERKKEEKILGEAEVLAVFKMGEQKIAGLLVKSGRINKSDQLVIKREGKTIGRAAIVSMKHKESDISEAIENEEFGAVLDKDIPFTKGDIMVAISHS